jgi:tetratricopeptide (TPR) repeat protein
MKIELAETEKLTSQPADVFEVREAQAELLVGLPGKQAEARTRLENLAHEDSNRSEPWANLGYLAWREGNQVEAVEHFAKAVELGNRSPRLLLNFAQLAARDKPDASIAALNTLLALEPKNLDACLLLANMQMERDQFSAAATTVSSIETVNTVEQRDNLLYLRAFAAMQLGYLADARKLAENLKEVSTSAEFQFRATQILRSLDSVNSAEASPRKLKAKRSGT